MHKMQEPIDRNIEADNLSGLGLMVFLNKKVADKSSGTSYGDQPQLQVWTQPRKWSLTLERTDLLLLAVKHIIFWTFFCLTPLMLTTLQLLLSWKNMSWISTFLYYKFSNKWFQPDNVLSMCFVKWNILCPRLASFAKTVTVLEIYVKFSSNK